MAPAGWYDDGQHPGQLRYWDGAAWTEQFAPSPAIAPSAIAPHVPDRRRRAWPWVLAASCVGFLAVVGVGTWLLVSFVFDATGGPRQAVETFDRAWATSDCDLLESVTTEAFRDADGWDGGPCAAFTPDPPEYDIVVQSVTVSGAEAIVLTRERWTDVDGEFDEIFEYRMLRMGDQWRIDSYVAADGDVSPIG